MTQKTEPMTKQQHTPSADLVHLRGITLVNRMLKDEWEMFLYTKYDADSNRNAYRFGIKDDIADIFRKMKRTFHEIGFPDYFLTMDIESCDRADEIYSTIEAAKNRIFTRLVDTVPYQYAQPLCNIITTYVFATMGEALVKNTRFNKNYSALKRDIENYTKELNIPLLNPVEKVKFVDDDTADMMVRKIIEILKKEL